MPASRSPLFRDASAGRRTRRGRSAAFVWAAAPCLLALALFAGPLRAEDEPPPARDILLAAVATDPEGEAERLARRAREALAAGQPRAAYADLVRLAEAHGDVLVPLSYVLGAASREGDGALRWPGVRVANLGLVRLPQAERDLLTERWGPDAGVLWNAARRGDEQALRELAHRYGALPAGGRALRVLARRAHEAGRYADAARRLEAWLWLRPDAPAARRAAAVAEWTDVLRATDDAGGVLALAKRYADLAPQPVTRGGRTRKLDALFWAKPEKRLEPLELAEPRVPERLVTLWSRSLDDASRYAESWEPPDPDPIQRVVTAGVLVDGASLVLHRGRHVVRMDARTGLERWRFPARPGPRLPDPATRYLWPDIPVRSVTRAGDLLLVVLGDPGASGSYQWRDEIQDAASLRDEVRLRLAALDYETGALRWVTGRHDDTHAVLGDLATGVATPPLVEGERVYIGLAQRLGVGTYYAACLDLKTGAPMWVRRVADSLSGRSPDRSDDDRFLHRHLHSLAWGARPVVADGELCFVPHAGLAAGLRAADGQLRWIRALPRYALHRHHDAGMGPSARNVPQAFGDAWILAPLDCPQLVCLARGTGTLRWMKGPDSSAELPVWRDLHHVGPDPKGRPAVWMSSLEGGLVLDARGAYANPLNDADPETMAGGSMRDGARGYVEQGVHWYAQGERLSAHAFFPDANGIVKRSEVALPDEAPADADLHRVGAGWLLVGVDRVALVADAEETARVLADEVTAEPDAASRATAAVRAAMRARLALEPDDFEGALERWQSVGDARAAAASGERIAQELTLWLDAIWGMTDEDTTQGLALRWLKTLAPQLWKLPPDLRGPGLRIAARAWMALGKGPEAVALLDRWIAEPGRRLVPRSPFLDRTSRVLVRGDLLAAELLDEVRERHPSSLPALQRRERRHLEAITALLDAPEPALREAIRRAAGTEAAAVGRRRLADRLEADGRLAAAAALHADLRLDASPRERNTPTRLLRSIARLQVAEAALLERAGEPDAARSLLIDVARWAPPGLRDRRGRKLDAGVKALADTHGRRPRRRGTGRSTVDVWTGIQNDPDPNQLGSIYWAGMRGPGVADLGDTSLLVRGLTPELWSLKLGTRIAALPGDDEGWFGGRLQSVDAWVPGAGILVSSIVAGEPADTSRVQAGDWIRRWNGRPVPDLPSFIAAVAASKPGAWIDVEVWRRGEQLLDRFRAGRRPLDQPPRRTDDAYSALWVAEGGRILFPTRSGLDWIDTGARTRRPLWRWKGSGTVLRADVFGGEAYVTVERSGFDDLIVAVDLADGRERWRRAIQGSVQRTQASGSALWVDASEPGWSVALDRATGEVRVAIRTLTTRRDEYRRTWLVAFVADATPAGRGFAVTRHRSDPEMLCANTTTGRVEWTYKVGGRRTRLARRSGYLDPQLDADAIVAVVHNSETLRLFVPDPLGNPPHPRRDVWDAGTNQLRTDSQDHGGSFTDDARVFVRGNTLHMVRNLRDRVTVWGALFNFDEINRTRTGQQPAGFPLVNRNNERMLTGGRHQPYVIDCTADHDGIYVLGALFGDEPWMEVRYASDFGSQRLINANALEARRHRPMRVGERLIVPTDRGAEVYPLVPLDD